MKKFNKGFTLIELLVVIAIIGILSSIVLASLSSARTKGEDAAITSTLSNMRAQAELYYSNNTNTYGVTASNCDTGIFNAATPGGLDPLMESLKTRGTPNCIASTTAWAVWIPLKTAGGSACADSTGNSVSSSTKASYTITTGVCI